MRVHTRDKPRATKRVLKRPFDADPFMKGIQDRLVMGKTTMLSKVTNSADYTHKFKDSCKRRGVEYHPVALAKHRFSCLQKGLSAHVDPMMPLLDTAKYTTAIGDRRESKVGLAYCRETTEVRVQVATMTTSVILKIANHDIQCLQV